MINFVTPYPLCPQKTEQWINCFLEAEHVKHVTKFKTSFIQLPWKRQKCMFPYVFTLI